MARFSKFLTDKHGTTAVEFSLVAMLFLTLVFGLFETARLFLAQSAIQYAVEEATRYNIAHEDATQAQLLEIATSTMDDMLVSTDDLTLEGPTYSVVAGVNFVQMNATYRFQPFLIFFLPDSWASIDLTASSRMPVRQ